MAVPFTASILSAGSGLVSAYYDYELQRQAAKFEKMQADFNARMIDRQAKDALDRGNKLANDHKKKVNKLIGSQKARLAAQGLSLDSGTALDLQTETAVYGAQDVATIRNNAWRQAFGLKQESVRTRLQSEFNVQSTKNKARSSLIGGVLGAAQSGLNVQTSLSKIAAAKSGGLK